MNHVLMSCWVQVQASQAVWFPAEPREISMGSDVLQHLHICEAQNALNGKPTTVGDPSRWTWALFQDWLIYSSQQSPQETQWFSLALMFKKIKFKGTGFGSWCSTCTDLSNMWESTMSRKVPEGRSGSAGTAQESQDRMCACTTEQNHPGANTAQGVLP